MQERLIEFFGKGFSQAERIQFYDYIEHYIEQNVQDWDKAPDTDTVATKFAIQIKELGNGELALLLMTAGYIPEFYGHDSSQETLYSKLAEVLVCEWAIRIGFSDSSIQKQKASKEDVTISIGNSIIVCDAKTFRLGRSQAAPNVKDTIKKADYDKWKEFYRGKEYQKDILYSTIGGLITFPILHRWKKKSDVVLYCTDKDDPIIILYYEYLSYMLVGGFGHDKLTNTLANYGQLFPNKTKDIHDYFQTIVNSIFGENNSELTDFIKLSLEIMNEMVAHKKQLLIDKIAESSKIKTAEISKMTADNLEELKARLIKAETDVLSKQFEKQVINIDKFRIEKNGSNTDSDDEILEVE